MVGAFNQLPSYVIYRPVVEVDARTLAHWVAMLIPVSYSFATRPCTYLRYVCAEMVKHLGS